MTLIASQPNSASDPAAARAWLETSAGERFPIQAGCSLGRSVSNEVPLPGEKVSRHHAVIQSRGQDAFWLADAGSVNGTWLNGRRLAQASRIYEGDTIAIGPHRLTFHHPGGQRRPLAECSIADLTSSDAKPQYCWRLMVQLVAPSRLDQTVGAARVPSLVGGWLDRCRELVQDYGGAIHQYIGHGFLASWGDHGESRAAVASAVSALGRGAGPEDPSFRVVLHYGQVNVNTAVAVGEDRLGGPAVNFIFRVDKLAASLNASSLISEVAQALLKPHLAFAEAGQHALPGFEGEQRFCSVMR